MVPKPARHRSFDQLACIVVACACALLVGLFAWLIAETLLGAQ